MFSSAVYPKVRYLNCTKLGHKEISKLRALLDEIIVVQADMVFFAEFEPNQKCATVSGSVTRLALRVD